MISTQLPAKPAHTGIDPFSKTPPLATPKEVSTPAPQSSTVSPYAKPAGPIGSAMPVRNGPINLGARSPQPGKVQPEASSASRSTSGRAIAEHESEEMPHTSMQREQASSDSEGEPALPLLFSREQVTARVKRSFADTDQTLILPGTTPALTPEQQKSVTAEHELAAAYGEVLGYARGGETPRNAYIPGVPQDSLFGRWWQQLHAAFQNPEYLDWANRNGIDTATVSFSPKDGALSANVNGELKRFTQAQNPEWAHVSRSIWAAARVAAPKALEIRTDEAFSRDSVPFERVGEFYGEDPTLIGEAATTRAATLAANQTFIDTDLHNPLRRPTDRSQTVLESQQSVLLKRSHTYTARKAGDTELVALYAKALSEAPEGQLARRVINDVPAQSSFGQWWGRYNDALQSPDFLAWVKESRLDTNARMYLDPKAGTLQGMVDGKETTFSLDDHSGWAQVSGPILYAGKLVIPEAGRDIIGLTHLDKKRTILAFVGCFYGENFHLNADAAHKRASELQASKTFGPLSQPGASSLQAFSTHEQKLADIGNQDRALGILKTLQTQATQDPTRNTIEDLKNSSMKIDVGSSFEINNHLPADEWISVKRFLIGSGINVPQNREQLQNLIEVMSNPLPVPAANNNVPGVLAKLSLYQRSVAREISKDTGKNPDTVAGYELRQAANWGATPALIVQRLKDYLIEQHLVGEHIASAASHLALVKAAPEFLVKDLPGDIHYGSREWAALSAAVNRIEKKQPGASAEMTFKAIMAFGYTDAVTPTDEAEQNKA